MAEDLCVSNGSKEDKYRMLLPQIECLIEGEDDLVANLANVAAALKETFRFFWVGFYLVKGDELVLAPFQRPGGLYADKERPWCLRESMGES